MSTHPISPDEECPSPAEENPPHPDEATRAALLELETRRQHALLAGDVAALAEMFDDSLVHIHAPGVTHTKAQMLEHVGTRRAYVNIERGELLVRVFGDIAILTGDITNRLRNPDGSERTVSGVVTQVARNVAGTWKFVSFQMTPFGKQVWGALPSEERKQA